MNYKIEKRTSYGSRIKNSFAGILGGFALIIVGSYLLWWNEGRTVRQSDAIVEAKRATQSVGDISKFDPQLDGKLIHAQGLATTDNIIGDSELNIVATAIRVDRQVQYYQYVESSKTEKQVKFGGEEVEVTTYSYKPSWNSRPIDSRQFSDPSYQFSNFVLAQIEGQTWTAANVSFGAYQLPDFLKSAIGGAKALTINNPEDVATKVKSIVKLMPSNNQPPAIPQGLVSAPGSMSTNQMQGYQVANTPMANQDMVHVQSNIIYLGSSPNQPRIGDVKISYDYVLPSDISIVAKVTNNTFEPFVASNGNTFSKLSMGKVSADNMFEDAKSANMTMAWILRVVGIILIIAGFNAILAPLQVLASVIPLLGTILGVGTGLVAGVLGVVWSLLIIAIAWFRFRPLLSTVLIVIVAALIFFLYKKGKKAKETVPPVRTE